MNETAIEKLVVVTRQTALEELNERFNTREQSRFYIEHMGASFGEYETAHEAYQRALETLKASLPRGVRHQFIERAFLPNFSFGVADCVVTLGADGLVVNSAKYLTTQPLVAFNPDARRIDGVLVPFQVEAAHRVLDALARGNYRTTPVSMATAQLNDGQSLLAVNDLFIGQRTHTSARYALRLQSARDTPFENQSSSGIIVSTGAGSTGWLRSILEGANKIVAAQNVGTIGENTTIAADGRFAWDADHLAFNVREPFQSKVSSARVVSGRIDSGDALEIVSQMPQNGVIFSDGVEEDYLEFNSGTIAEIRLADKKLHLVTQVW